MKLTEKRSAIRSLRDQGKISLTGLEIASLNNDAADSILAQHGVSTIPKGAEQFDTAPTAPTPPTFEVETVPAPTPPTTETDEEKEKRLAILGDFLGLVTPHGGSDGAKNEVVQALTKRVDELEQRKPREITVKLPTGEKKELGLQHKSFGDLLLVVSCEEHAYLVGPAGSFKTSAAGAVAKALGLEFSSISVCQQTTAVALLGYMDATGTYRATEFRKRYEEGGLFLLDEIDNGNPNVLAVLNSAISNGACAFPDGMVERSPKFRLVATANTYGLGANAQYVGRCQLDAATLDRFAFIEWGYDDEMEAAISTNLAWCKRVQSLRASADKLRSKIVISPRATFAGEKMLAAGMPQTKVEKLKIWGATSKEEQAKIEAGAC